MIKIKIKNKKLLNEIEVPSYINPSYYQDYVKKEKSFGDELAKNFNKLKSRNIDATSAKKLGGGAYGKAYELKNGDILKITSDISEAQASKYLSNFLTKHLVKIKDVFQFPQEENSQEIKYGILQEKLLPLEVGLAKKISININIIRNVISDSDVLFRYWNKMNDLLLNVENNWQNNIELKKTFNDNQQDILDAIKNAKKSKIFLDNIKGFANIINELYFRKIKYIDFNEGNFMKRADGTLVLIDLGGDSQVPVKQNIDKL